MSMDVKDAPWLRANAPIYTILDDSFDQSYRIDRMKVVQKTYFGKTASQLLDTAKLCQTLYGWHIYVTPVYGHELMVFLEDRPFGSGGVIRDVLTLVSSNTILARLYCSDHALQQLAQLAAKLQAEKALLAVH